MIRLAQPKLDTATWRTEVPLIVIERCLSSEQEGSKLVLCWLTIRWMLAAGINKLSTRFLARRMGSSHNAVSRYLIELVRLNLLVVDHQLRTTFGNMQNVYTIDLNALESESLNTVAQTVDKWRNSGDHIGADFRILPLSADLHVPPTEHDMFHPRNMHVPPTEHDMFHPRNMHVPPTEHDMFHPRNNMEGRKEGRKEGSAQRTRASARKLRTPDAPLGAIPLPAHPIDLWASAA